MPASQTDLHPSAERAIAALQKPQQKSHWDSPYVLMLKQRELDLEERLDLLLDALNKIQKSGRQGNYDPAFEIATEALEAFEQVDRFIEARDAAAEAAELQAAE